MIYRIGSIGLEGHTDYTFQPMQRLSNAVLAAVASSDSAALEKFKKNPVMRPETKFYSDYREMLEKEELDIVAVYTDHGSRAQSIIDAAATGSAVYTEKPLGMTLEENEKVKQAVAQANALLTMMLSMRCDGRYIKLREIAQSGAIGEIAQATSQKSYKVGERPAWMKNPKTFAGIIPFIACHSLDLIRWCTNLDFVKGTAFQSNVGRPDLEGMENTASIIALAENGATFSSRLDYCRPELAKTWGDDRLRIAGVEGVVELLDDKLRLITQKEQIHEVEPAKSTSQFDNLIAAIEKREELVVPPQDCYRITEICIKLREAAKTQSVVDL